MIDYTKTMHEENTALAAKVRELEAKLPALKGFARDIIQAMWDGGVDGCDVQNLAEKYGLIESTFATEADAEIHDHVSPGDPFFRFADWLRDAVIEMEAAPPIQDAPGKWWTPLPLEEKRCELCLHYDPLQRPGKGFCMVNKEHWPTVEATHCCEKFAPQGDSK